MIDQSRAAVSYRKSKYTAIFLDSCRAQGYDKMDTLYFAPNDQQNTVSKSVELCAVRCVLCGQDERNVLTLRSHFMTPVSQLTLT
jgi:hypothetical protein